MSERGVGAEGSIESIEGSVWPWLKDYDPNEIRRTIRGAKEAGA